MALVSPDLADPAPEPAPAPGRGGDHARHRQQPALRERRVPRPAVDRRDRGRRRLPRGGQPGRRLRDRGQLSLRLGVDVRHRRRRHPVRGGGHDPVRRQRSGQRPSGRTPRSPGRGRRRRGALLRSRRRPDLPAPDRWRRAAAARRRPDPAAGGHRSSAPGARRRPPGRGRRAQWRALAAHPGRRRLADRGRGRHLHPGRARPALRHRHRRQPGLRGQPRCRHHRRLRPRSRHAHAHPGGRVRLRRGLAPGHHAGRRPALGLEPAQRHSCRVRGQPDCPRPVRRCCSTHPVRPGWSWCTTTRGRPPTRRSPTRESVGAAGRRHRCCRSPAGARR